MVCSWWVMEGRGGEVWEEMGKDRIGREGMGRDRNGRERKGGKGWEVLGMDGPGGEGKGRQGQGSCSSECAGLSQHVVQLCG
jgi:hypothetical protein